MASKATKDLLRRMTPKTVVPPPPKPVKPSPADREFIRREAKREYSRSRVFLGKEIVRWKRLARDLELPGGCRGDAQLATILLDTSNTSNGANFSMIETDVAEEEDLSMDRTEDQDSNSATDVDSLQDESEWDDTSTPVFFVNGGRASQNSTTVPEPDAVPIKVEPEQGRLPIKMVPEPDRVPIKMVPEPDRVPIKMVPEPDRVPISMVPNRTVTLRALLGHSSRPVNQNTTAATEANERDRAHIKVEPDEAATLGTLLGRASLDLGVKPGLDKRGVRPDRSPSPHGSSEGCGFNTGADAGKTADSCTPFQIKTEPCNAEMEIGSVNGASVFNETCSDDTAREPDNNPSVMCTDDGRSSTESQSHSSSLGRQHTRESQAVVESSQAPPKKTRTRRHKCSECGTAFMRA
ncbi:hypothetical protein BaRGS_00013598, partial [Batillaria attramentaria]